MTEIISQSHLDALPACCARFSRAFAERRPGNLRPEREGVVVREMREWNGERLFFRFDWDCRKMQYVAATLRVQLFPSSRSLWLGSLEVHPHHRRRGVGSAIVRGLESAAVASGLQHIRLFSRRSASRFWIRLNYQPEVDRRYFQKTIGQPAGPSGGAAAPERVS